MIGEWLRATGKRDAVQLATKVGMLPGDGGAKLAPARIAAACEASLQRLGTDRIDLYFAHQDDDAVPQEAALEAFSKLVKAGKVRVVGASNFHAGRLKSANDAAAPPTSRATMCCSPNITWSAALNSKASCRIIARPRTSVPCLITVSPQAS